MIRIIIADDERWVLRIIHEALLPMDDIDIIGEAGDGVQALELCSKHQPDILVTDIRMPGLSGLELIEKIAGASPHTKSIIISGYDDFEFAKQAITLQVFSYILKPIAEEDLRTAVRQASQVLLKEQKQQERLEVQQGHLAYARQVEFWTDVWHGRLTQNKSYSDAAMEAGLLLDSRKLCILLLTIVSTDATPETLQLLRQSLKQPTELLVSLYKDSFEACIVGLDEAGWEYGVFLLARQEPHIDAVYQRMQMFLAYLRKTHGLRAVAALSGFGEISNWYIDQTNVLMKQAMQAYDNIFFNESDIAIYQPSADMRETKSFSISYETSFRLYHSLRMHDRKRFIDTLDEIMTMAANIPYLYKVEDIKSSLWKLITNIAGMLDTAQFDISILYTGDSLSVMGAAFFRCRTITALHSFILDLAELMIPAKSNPDDSITLAQHFVQNHYQEDITLELVASIVFHNPTYFSSLFKKRTGKTFLEYLTDLRMKKARDLIIHTKLKIYEVTEQVGYADPKYFSKLFKKYFKAGPRKYRESFSPDISSGHEI